MQKLTAHLWLDTGARQAAELYASVFGDSSVGSVTRLEGTPSGVVEVVTARIRGMDLTLMAAGPTFRLNPSVSFLVACEAPAEVDAIWAGLSAGGTALMDLGSYPFSDRYGWIQDRWGVSWQVMDMGERPVTARVVPTLMFVGPVCGKAEEAMRFYASVFPDSRVGEILRYGPDEAPNRAGTVKHEGFTVLDRELAAMDSAYDHAFAFNEAASFVVQCETQAEMDRYWAALSAHPDAEQCGWLKDRYGLSWQIVPAALDRMMREPASRKRVTAAFLGMKKLDLAALERAAAGG